MGNKLKDLFAENIEQLTGVIHFADSSTYKEFLDKMEKMYIDGKPEEINGVESIQYNMSDGSNQYTVEEQKNIKRVMIYIPQDEISFPIILNGRCEQFAFVRKFLKDKVELTTPSDAIVEVSLILDDKKESMQFSYRVHDEKAGNLKELINAYERMNALIDYLYINCTNNEKEKMQSYFKESIAYVQRLEELATVLEICIEPSMIRAEDDREGIIAKLYLLCVKKRKIRSDDRLNFINGVSVMECKEGQEILTSHIYEENYEIFNKKVTIYTVNCIFNAVVSKIEEDKNETMKIYFTDSDTKPMYRAYSGYMTLQEAEKEREELFEYIDQYRNSRKFLEQLEELLENK